MIKIVRTNSENVEFIEVVKYLDADLAERDRENMPIMINSIN
ncbi:MAG: hypothetical protein QNK20_13710 [Aureibaculum sp.]|nr:hypothetical protein [Aureibaculum sp.]